MPGKVCQQVSACNAVVPQARADVAEAHALCKQPAASGSMRPAVSLAARTPAHTVRDLQRQALLKGT